MTVSIFQKAISRIDKINTYLNRREWDIRNNGRIQKAQQEILKIQRDTVNQEIDRLKRCGEECRLIIGDKIYTSPFGPEGQQHLPQTKRDQQMAKTELTKITEAINDLRQLWLDLLKEKI